MKIILASDSYKGCLTSEEVEKTFAEHLSSKGAETICLPMSDGGEGMLEAFISSIGGEIKEVRTHDPLMRPITAHYGITTNGTAIIETAKACGLTLLSPEERNPMMTTTYGVGEIIADAIDRGCRNFIIGLGGSGTSDCGRGMIESLTCRLTERDAVEELPYSVMSECRFTLASDVRNPLYGPEGAAYTFGAQKGATREMIRILDEQAKDFAMLSSRLLGRDASKAPGAGAAGGLGYAFIQYFGATVKSGADLLLDFIGFDRKIQEADIIITGEGRSDRQTLMGKLPERILQRGIRHNIPVWLVSGRICQREELLSAGFSKVEKITPDYMKTSEAIIPDVARANIRYWVESNF